MQRAKALRAQDPRMRNSNPGPEIGVAGGRTVSQTPEGSAESKEAQGNASRSFGGFSKGFLLSAPKTIEPRPQIKKQTDKSSTRTHTAGRSSAMGGPSTQSDVDMPFIKPQSANTKGPVFPEVQEAMKEAYPLLNTQG